MKHSEIIDSFGSPAAVARDLGVSESTVTTWRQRQSIPVYHWVALVRAAKRRGIWLSYEELATGVPVRKGVRPATESSQVA